MRGHLCPFPARHLQTYPHTHTHSYCPMYFFGGQGQGAPFLFKTTPILTSPKTVLFSFLFYSTPFSTSVSPSGSPPIKDYKNAYFHPHSLKKFEWEVLPIQYGIHPYPGLKSVFQVLKDFYCQIQQTFPVLISWCISVKLQSTDRSPPSPTLVLSSLHCTLGSLSSPHDQYSLVFLHEVHLRSPWASVSCCMSLSFCLTQSLRVVSASLLVSTTIS